MGPPVGAARAAALPPPIPLAHFNADRIEIDGGPGGLGFGFFGPPCEGVAGQRPATLFRSDGVGG